MPSDPRATFTVGERVAVLNAFRLPTVEEVRHVGAITRVEAREPALPNLYWVSGLAVARTAQVLRKVDQREQD